MAQITFLLQQKRSVSAAKITSLTQHDMKLRQNKRKQTAQEFLNVPQKLRLGAHVDGPFLSFPLRVFSLRRITWVELIFFAQKCYLTVFIISIVKWRHVQAETSQFESNLKEVFQNICKYTFSNRQRIDYHHSGLPFSQKIRQFLQRLY